MTDGVSSLITRTAFWVTALRFDDLPDSVVAMAKRCLLDQIGVQVRGSTLAHIRPVLELVREMDARGESVVTGQGFRTTAPYAAYANGVFGHSCEFDDSHLFAWHPGVCVIPAALAVAEREGSSGRDLIVAIVAGYQAMAVLGGPMRTGLHKAGWHGMKVLGVFGAAAATARLLGLDAARTAQALAIAASDASGTMEYDQSGGEVKRLHAGAASRSGVQAALLARRGLTGPLTVIEGLRGIYRLFAEGGDPDIEKYWATDFHILNTMFKLRPAVGTIHAPLDAIEELQRRHGFHLADVEAISAGVAPYAVAHGAAIYRPSDMIGAQFSLAFSVGLLLTRGSTRLVDYMNPALWTDPSILQVADRVTAHALTFAADAPPLGSVVTITLRDGRKLEYYQRAFRGHGSDPASDHDIGVKFQQNVAELLTETQAQALRAQIDGLETSPIVGTLLPISLNAAV